ncbi:MAG: tyrosine-protein phosphatase [Ignavibacteriota bacterium]
MRRLCYVLLLAVCATAQTETSFLHRVDDNVYRGKQPKKEDFAKLAQMGIKTVLDLRGGLVYKSWEREVAETAGLQYVRVGLSGILPPRKKQMEKILALLEDPSRGPVFIHCRRGADRSGVVIACYRVSHYRWTNAQAMQEAEEQGFSRLEVLMRRYVRHFRASLSPVASR